MEQHPISELLKLSVESITNVIDVDIVIGDPIKMEGSTVIPISKIKCGFVSGGMDQKKTKEYVQHSPFGGGAGAHASIVPIAFLVETKGDVKILHLEEQTHRFDTVIDLIEALLVSSGIIKREKEKQVTKIEEHTTN